MMRTAWAAVAVLAWGGVCAAQDVPGVLAQVREGRVLRDEVCEMVDAYVQMKVQERLELSDEQMVKVLPLIRRSHQDRRELEMRRHRALKELRRLFMSGSASCPASCAATWMRSTPSCRPSSRRSTGYSKWRSINACAICATERVSAVARGTPDREALRRSPDP
jgi:hypothetical protein